MNLMKWNPLASEFDDFQSRLNRMFEQTMRRSFNDELLTIADWTPSVDISETEDAYLVKGELPGVNKDDVKVTLQDNMLTIQGERKQAKDEKNERYHRCECSYGNFVRSFRMPSNIDSEAIHADYKDGVLTVTLKKLAQSTEAVKSTEIKVQ